jgi:PAS domain S-box-containing protein
MKRGTIPPSGRESPFRDDELIVTKTDLKGRITYANDVFLRVARLSLRETLGQPHSIIRHPDMPRCVFKLLWDAIEAGGEIFAYVVNLASNGDHYWVLAHVTPSFDASGRIVGYHSNRRRPDPEKVARIVPIYRSLLEIEAKAADRKIGMGKSLEHMTTLLRDNRVSYDEFVFSL